MLKLNTFLGRKREVTDITVRLKDLFFIQSGDLFRLQNCNKLKLVFCFYLLKLSLIAFLLDRTAEEYSRAGSSFGLTDHDLMVSFLTHTTNIIPTSLTKLNDPETIKIAIAAFQVT